MRRTLATIALISCAACAAAEEYKLTLDPTLVITPLPEIVFEEPAVLPTIALPADVPLPPLDVSEAIGFERDAEAAERMQADSAEPVWTPPEKVGVSVRPVSDIRAEATPGAGGDEASYRPVFAYARDEEDNGLVFRVGLSRNGLCVDDYLLGTTEVQGFTLPPPEQRSSITFHIERSEPDPFSDFSARVRRPRR